ncbi:MAG: tRNA (guanosine(37)-N1)-methyltransferase TrmD [Bacillota bacterium]
MRIDVLTIFPELFISPLKTSIVKRAIEKNLLEVVLTDFRDYAVDKHRRVDDYPFGGGSGMVLKPEPIFRAWESIAGDLERNKKPRTILLCPQGRVFNQKLALELAQEKRLILICGHYEGVDERIRNYLVTDEISLGDYIITGGELGALVLIDAVTRLLPGVLGAEQSLLEESFSQGLLEYPQYTRPREFRGMEVPEILLSGNHKKIEEWRQEQAIKRTKERRPDLISSSKKGNGQDLA